MVVIAYALFLVNFAFGLAVRGGLIDSSRYRFVHHAIYFLVIVSLAAAAVAEAFRVGGRGWAPVGMVCLLLVMPRFRGRSRGHTIWASFCLAVYTAVVML